MLLTCDIGNSNIKAGIFSDNDLVETLLFSKIKDLETLYSTREISFTGVSSVVPAESEELKKFLDSNSYPHYFINKESKFRLKILYETPETLGTDRICSAEGAYFLNGAMKRNEVIISIDFGTATTINVIRYPGEFIGGAIAPGINLMSDSLHINTAQLPVVAAEDFNKMIGTSTKGCIASGVLNSALGMLDRILNYIKSTNRPGDLKIYITGGNSEKILSHIEFEYIFEKNLVLYGIKSLISLQS